MGLEDVNMVQVRAHFESVQRIATEATVPALVPRLRERLKECTGVEVLVECLRVRKVSASNSRSGITLFS